MAKVRDATGSGVASAQLFRTPTIAGLAAFLSSGAGSDDAVAAIPAAPFGPEERCAGVPCSANQAQMVVLHEMDPDSAAYHLPEALRLRGALDADALQAALHALAARHEILRTRLLQRDLPVEHPRALPALVRRSVRARGGERAMQALIDREASRPFRLMEEVPLRVVLVEVAPDDHALLLAMHHVIRCAACRPGSPDMCTLVFALHERRS